MVIKTLTLFLKTDSVRLVMALLVEPIAFVSLMKIIHHGVTQKQTKHFLVFIVILVNTVLVCTSMAFGSFFANRFTVRYFKNPKTFEKINETFPCIQILVPLSTWLFTWKNFNAIYGKASEGTETAVS